MVNSKTIKGTWWKVAEGGGGGGEGEGGLPCGIAAYYTIDSHLLKIIETKAHNQVVM